MKANAGAAARRLQSEKELALISDPFNLCLSAVKFFLLAPHRVHF